VGDRCNPYSEREASVFDLKGRVAVVTGGNGGIGLGMARGLAAAGAGIVVAARNAEKSRKAVAEVRRARRARARRERRRDRRGRGRAARERDRARASARLDILVNNAGTNIRKPIHEYTLAEWHRVLDTNLTSAFLCSHAAYPLMKQAGAAR